MEVSEKVELLKKANMYMGKRKFLEADTILDKLLKSTEVIEIDKHGKVMDFSTQLEFVLYCNMDNHTKISWSRNYLSEIYCLKGIIKYEDKKYKEALIYYEKALRWNPVSVLIYSEILESYIKLNELEKFEEIWKKTIRVAVRPVDIAMFYKKLAFVWIERGENELAYNLLLYSKLIFPRKEADIEIAYLEKRYGTKIKYFPDLATVEYIKANELEYKRPEYIIPTYIGLIKMMLGVLKKEEYQNRNNYLLTIDYYHGLYFHKPGAAIHSEMLALQREYELKYPVGKEDN